MVNALVKVKEGNLFGISEDNSQKLSNELNRGDSAFIRRGHHNGFEVLLFGWGIYIINENFIREIFIDDGSNMDIFSIIIVESIDSQVDYSFIDMLNKAVIITGDILDSHVGPASGKVSVILVILGV